MKTKLVLLAALAILVAGVIGFHRERRSAPTRVQLAGEKKILLIGNGSNVATLDPHLANGHPEHFVISAIFEGLVAADENDPDKFAPGVAESWDTKDFIHWTFKLRPDAKWSDGTPVTAKDFIYAWKRILTPALGSPYAEMLHLLKGAADFNKGKTNDFSTVGAKAADDRTLEVTLDGTAPYFPGMLKHYAWFPVPKQAIEKFGSADDPDNPWARPGSIVCNGPFTLQDWRINHFIDVKKNSAYWDAARVKLHGIHFFPIDNAEAEERVFLDNQLHATYAVPMAKISYYREKRPPYFRQTPELTTEFYRCNVTRPPLDNPKVRHALALALDRKSLVDKVIKSGHLPATGLVPPQTSTDYTPVQATRFDPEEARKLLAEAGFPEGKGFRQIELLTNSSDTSRTVAEFFQESWRKHLGITVSILQQDWQVYLDSMNKLSFDIVRGGWVGDYHDPFTFLSIFRSTDGNNCTGWKNPRYDELMLASTREPSIAGRMKLLQEGEEILLREMPVIPIYWRINSSLQRGEIKNWKDSSIGHRCYKALDLGPYQPLPPQP